MFIVGTTKTPVASSPESEQNATTTHRRALTFASAPVSDESDFDRDDVAEAEPKRKKTGKKKNDELPLQPRGTNSKTSKNAVVRSNTMPDNQSSADELEIENEDSQTFAGFKMRTAKQERTRRQAELESRQTRKATHSGRAYADDRGNEPGSYTQTASTLTQSVKLSKRDRLQFPESTNYMNEYESLPYHVLQRKLAVADVEEDAEEDRDMHELIPGGHMPQNGEDILVKGNVPPADVLEGARRRNVVTEKKHQRQRISSSPASSGSESQSSKAGSSSPVVTSSATQQNQSMQSIPERNLDDSSDEDEGLLRFDIQTGKLIRPVNFKAGSETKDFEPGQSEEEDNFVPTLVDGPRPST
ncbi:hypothetical protein QFC19_000687 [Naganishia cerealis]|uniref:Uncharacterized protein n=1 Tax=Naganishia cerealis TaxID=610337 RepID=A0ACC2WKJ7_9TREE|nr:hypothetical protein QFC19_000687 [Naganishia cerealis]